MTEIAKCCVCFEPNEKSTNCNHCLCNSCYSNMKGNLCPVCRTGLTNYDDVEKTFKEDKTPINIQVSIIPVLDVLHTNVEDIVNFENSFIKFLFTGPASNPLSQFDKKNIIEQLMAQL